MVRSMKSSIPTSASVLLCAFLLIPTAFSACASVVEVPVLTPLPAAVAVLSLQPATPIMLDDRQVLAYELILENPTDTAVRLDGIDVYAGETRIARYAESSLHKALIVHPEEVDGVEVILPPRSAAVFYGWLPFLRGMALPTTLRHQVSGENLALTVNVDVQGEPRLIEPPVEGPGWIVANAPGPMVGHRRAALAAKGSWYLAQRYAIDMVRLTGDDIHRGEPTENKSHFAYGVPLLAVADGQVVAVKDGIPENIPHPDERAVAINRDTLAGNYVVLDIGAGDHAVYAHLIPGSLKVAVGDTVKTGDVLGRIGNSGNSTQPHLHFHMCDAPDALLCQGRAYAFPEYRQRVLDMRNPTKPEVGSPVTRLDALPGTLSIIDFPPYPTAAPTLVE
jgi:hypothetical protein